MERIWSTELPRHQGERVRLAGWLHCLRRLSKVSFLILRDGKGLAQVVIEDPALSEKVAAWPLETVLTVEGMATAEPQAPGGVELLQPVIELISASVAPPPFDLYRPALQAQLPTVLDHAPLALRHPGRRAIFHLASAAVEGFRRTLRALDFVEIATPKIVATATESGANVFALDYFGRPAYLAQSPQLYKQIMVGVFERVYEAGPVFRAEPHDTNRHLNEYVSLDVEMGFIEDHTTVMGLLTKVVTGMVAAVRAAANEEAVLADLLAPTVPDPIPAIHFRDALELVSTETGEDARAENDLAPAHERILGEWARRAHGSDFLFVVGYPLSKRPFYTHPDPGLPGYSRSFDLLFRGQELVTGGQRLHRHADYLAALAERGLTEAPFAGYLEAFKYGMPPHGGFAIGLERFIAQLVGARNIRETTLFPRDMGRLAP